MKNQTGIVLLLFMPIAHAEEASFDVFEYRVNTAWTVTGVGIRMKAWGGVFAGLDWAVALNEIGKTEQGDSRAHFRLGYEW